MDEANNEGYLAPYDYYPDDPFISGINMRELKKIIYNTKNITSTIIILDCCYAGIATKNPMAPQEREKNMNLFTTNVENLIESSNQGQGKIVLASSGSNCSFKRKK